MPSSLKFIFWLLLCITPGPLAIVDWSLTSETETTLVITAASQNSKDLRPETIVLSQKGSIVHWTATGIYYVSKYGEVSKFEARTHEGRIKVEGLDLAKAFDHVKSKETHAIGPIPRTGTLPYSIVLVASDRVGVCPDLNGPQFVEFTRKSSPMRKVLDDILHSRIYAKQNDMLDFVRDPDGVIEEKPGPLSVQSAK